MGAHDKADNTGRCRIYVPVDKTASFVRLLQNATVTSATVHMTAGVRPELGRKPITTGSAPDAIGSLDRGAGTTPPDMDSNNVVAFDMDQADLAVLERSGWIQKTGGDNDAAAPHTAVFNADLEGDDDDRATAASIPAPEPTGPFPWEKPAAWRTPFLFAGGSVTGGLATLAIVHAMGQDVGIPHAAALIALVLLVIGFERVIALVELFWQVRIADRDAAATAAEIERIDPSG